METQEQTTEAGRQWVLQEAAEFLRLPVKTTRQMAKAGKLPSYRVGRRYRFDPQALREWTAQGGTNAERAAA